MLGVFRNTAPQPRPLQFCVNSKATVRFTLFPGCQGDKTNPIAQSLHVYSTESAYMAVTNLVEDQPDHAKIIADFAIDAIKAANETLVDPDDPEKGCVNIRVGESGDFSFRGHFPCHSFSLLARFYLGFHSGPVVADVVGSRNPVCTGDTSSDICFP